MKNINLTLLILLGTTLYAHGQFTQDLFIPDTLHGPIYDLDMRAGTVEFTPGVTTNTFGYNGNILGPTLIMQQGEDIQLNVTNSMSETTTTHWHGMHVAPEDDGGPHSPISSGATWSPDFTVLDRATTFWYHPHLHHTTNEQVTSGLAGMIIIKDAEEAALALPRTYGVDDIPLILQTKIFAANGQIRTMGQDSTTMVNAVIEPKVDLPAQMVRFRLLNGSTGRVFNLAFNDDRPFFQIGTDGGLLASPNLTTRLMLSPGERAEIIVDLSADQGSRIFLMSKASELGTLIPGGAGVGPSNNPLDGTDFNFMAIDVVTALPGAITTVPNSLAVVPNWNSGDADVVRVQRFTGDPPTESFGFNNNLMDMMRIDDTVRLGDIEIWELDNETNTAHPFHIHDIQFRILTRNGVAPGPEESGLKDVVLVKAQEKVRFITQFTDFADDQIPYMYHCHILTHEDGGMMAQFIVVDTAAVTAADAPLKAGIELIQRDGEIELKRVNDQSLVELIDVQGKAHYQVICSGQVVIPSNNLAKGIYIVTVSNGTKRETFKLKL